PVGTNFLYFAIRTLPEAYCLDSSKSYTGLSDCCLIEHEQFDGNIHFQLFCGSFDSFFLSDNQL
ncbi:hypothetical protein, partial [uncultured Bacteroides sp.]|uniref:hypothetical protein n=1 Tax=uncultured Bacteroides sp. TaxID=162156 RepID=UPI0035A8ABF5